MKLKHCRWRPATAGPIRSSGHSRASRAAAATVEFAVCGGIFLTMVIIVVELGRGFMVIEQLNDAAAHCARVATLAGSTSDDVKSAADSVLKGMLLTDNSGSSLGWIKVTDTTTSTLIYDSENPPGSAATFTSGDTLKIEIYVPIKQVTWVPTGRLLGANNSNYLVGRASLVVE